MTDAVSCERALEALKVAIPDASDARVDESESRLSFSVRLSGNDLADAEQRLSGALAAYGFELILPEGVNNYSYVGDRPKKMKMIPTAVATSIVAAAVAISVLFTFVACDIFGVSIKTDGLQQGAVQNTTINIDDESIPEYIKELIKLDYLFNANSYDGFDEEQMRVELLKKYIEATGDVYAEYMTEEEYTKYTQDNQGDFVGIGVSIVNTTLIVGGVEYKVLNVTSVFKDSPAMEYGVKVGDCVAFVGKGEDRISVTEVGYDGALDLMLGEEGTEAAFSVFRKDSSQPSGYSEIEFSITRKKVVSESVTFRVSETDGKVGIVHVSGYSQPTATQFKYAVNSLLDAGCEYFVFDMRNNGGGALLSIEAVLSYFLNEGDLIVSTEYSNGEKREDLVRAVNYGSQYEGYNVSASEIGMYKSLKGKCVVLTNEYTASAAELFTATMRDYGFAEIVGNKTFGKGCMQNIMELSRYGLKGALKLTTAMYFSKSHTVYHGVGIIPDHSVDLSEEAKQINFFILPEEMDDQLQKAIEVLNGK